MQAPIRVRVMVMIPGWLNKVALHCSALCEPYDVIKTSVHVFSLLDFYIQVMNVNEQSRDTNDLRLHF